MLNIFINEYNVTGFDRKYNKYKFDVQLFFGDASTKRARLISPETGTT